VSRDVIGSNILLRAALALACIGVMFHPNGNIAMVAAAFVLPATIIGSGATG